MLVAFGPVEAIAHLGAGTTDGIFEASTAAHPGSHLLKPRSAELVQVVKAPQEAEQHDEHADEREHEGHRQKGDHRHGASKERDRGSLQVAKCMGIDRGLSHLARQARITLVEVVLNFAENALLVLRKRHRRLLGGVASVSHNQHPQNNAGVQDCRRCRNLTATAELQRVRSSGPHCCWPDTMRSSGLPGRAKVAGPMASPPNRSRIASTMSSVSLRPGPAASSRLSC